VIDRLVNHKDLINQIKQEGNKSTKKVEELREMFLNTNGKMDVFEQISVRISQAEAEVKILEDKFDYENKHIKQRLEQIAQTSELQTNVFTNLRAHTHEVMDELSHLKDTYRQQCETFVYEVRKLNDNIITNHEALQLRCNKLDGITHDQNLR